MASPKADSASDGKVVEIIRRRIANVMAHTREHGFGHEQAKLLTVGEIAVNGVSFVAGSDEDTEPRRGATAKVVMEMVVDECKLSLHGFRIF
jgi:hypothetical protein